MIASCFLKLMICTLKSSKNFDCLKTFFLLFSFLLSYSINFNGNNLKKQTNSFKISWDKRKNNLWLTKKYLSLPFLKGLLPNIPFMPKFWNLQKINEVIRGKSPKRIWSERREIAWKLFSYSLQCQILHQEKLILNLFSEVRFCWMWIV